MQDQPFILTISIVPERARCSDQYDYEKDLLALVQSFRLETQTQASIFRLNSASGVVSLFLSGQEALTESQQSFQYRHNEITGYESGFFQEQAQREGRYACAKEDGFIYMYRDNEIVQRPKRLYGDEIERELHSLVVIHDYTIVGPAEFDRLSAGASFNEERSK